MQNDHKELSLLSKDINDLTAKVNNQTFQVKAQESVIQDYDSLLSESQLAYEKVFFFLKNEIIKRNN